MKKMISLALVAIVAMLSITYAQNTKETYVADVDSKLFLHEIQNATYVGNHYVTESVGNLVVSHQIIRDNPRIESVIGYMSFMANETINKEMGNIGVVSEFDLKEPSKRVCHEIIKVGDTIKVGSEKLTVNLFIGDPVLYDYSPSLLYYVFRCGITQTTKGCTIGCFVDKKSFKIKKAHFLTIDGYEISNLSSPQNLWSNTRIEKYNNYYYRAFRDNINKRIIIARSTDLINWFTWMDISSAMSFVKGTSGNSFDETDIAIDKESSVLYFAVRSQYVVLGKVVIEDHPTISEMSYLSNMHPTRPSIAFFNGNLYLLGNARKDNYDDKKINGTVVNRCYPILYRMDTSFNVIKKWSGFSCIGGNYQVLQPYGAQLLCGLNFNRQGLSNTASLERCGVYFTSLYSITYELE